MTHQKVPYDQLVLRPEDVERFWPKVVCDDVSDCWVWVAGRTNGYGTFWALPAKRMVKAHCAAYATWRGPVPEGKELDHLCRVRSCVNPAHLEVVTKQVNSVRGYGMGGIYARRTACGRCGGELDAKRRLCVPCRRADNNRNARRYRERSRCLPAIN